MFKTITSGIKSIRVARGIKAMRNADNEVERLRARQYLAQLLGEQKGIASKIGQLMADSGNAEDPLQNVCDNVQPLPLKDIQTHLASIYSPEFLEQFLPTDEALAAASLSQVHRSQYNGQSIVLKIQYPDIRRHVESDLAFMGLLPGMGPV